MIYMEMADGDWKKRTGVEINYSSGDDERYPNANCGDFSPNSDNSDEYNDYHEYDGVYGKTPPRTQIIRRNKSRKEKEMQNARKVCKVIRASGKHVPVMDQFDGIAGDDDANQPKEAKWLSNSNKRSMKLLRGSERDLKLDFSDMPGRGTTTSTSLIREDRVESMPQPAIKIESSNRFLSLTSRLVTCKNVATTCKFRYSLSNDNNTKNRIEFYETFAKLIRMGNGDNVKRQICMVSQEEAMWQNELNDLIWLELQAWHADRTLQDQDKFLCQAREDVSSLLEEIMNYRFEKKVDQLSASSSDSGVHFLPNEECSKTDCIEENLSCVDCDEEMIMFYSISDCLKMSCPSCFDDQNCALQDVEAMLNRLEAAEALYPSSKAFASQYPLYLQEEFTARVKAMCLWYNFTKHHRLMFAILTLQLLSFRSTKSHYQQDSESSNGSVPNLPNVTLEDLSEFCKSSCFSNNDYSKMTHIYQFVKQIESGQFTELYRKYIENVLKVRDIRKALKFLEKIYTKVLRKAKLTLEKPKDGDSGNTNDDGLEKLDDSVEFELRRYGCWSEEAKMLNLPSYRPSFLFFSHIAVNVIHEYLSLRLDKKPEKPSPMSIGQLTKELKDGLEVAVLYRQRYQHNIHAALWHTPIADKYFKKSVSQFDSTLLNVLELYLEYLKQWVQLIQQERQQKNILEEEWAFALKNTVNIPGACPLVGSSFCRMASSMIKSIGAQLKCRVSDLLENVAPGCEYNKQDLLFACRELQCVCQETREKSLYVVALSKTLRKDLENYQDNTYSLHCNIVADSLAQFKRYLFSLCEILTEVINKVEKSLIVPDYVEETDRQALQVRYREVLHQFFKFGIDYLKEVCRLGTGDAKSQLCRQMFGFAHHWMEFVKERCERGRGLRPRWANHGFEFLMTVSEPNFTNHLTNDEFEDLKCKIDACISHVIGTASSPTVNNSPTCYIPSRSRGPSPCNSPLQRSSSKSGNSTADSNKELSWTPKNVHHNSRRISRLERVKNAINDLEKNLNSNLRNSNLIGKARDASPPSEKRVIHMRQVSFSWQRGVKIGQGRFGKVYTAVNNQTGELMAVKEISILPNDHQKTISNIAREIKLFEKIRHDNLVKYYGVEIHKDEMLIFMELCTQGTLESLVAATESSLPEPLIRRYTNQLVNAITTLHQNSIVHRDVKTANIFLTNEGNCLKIGDFGSAVKIRAHTTVPGELQGYVGTQAYMAPEVFTQSSTEGHGRSVDIWSLGCVLVEMASGKRPWADYDSNYQIMFKVGMGEIPSIPITLSEEGTHFATLCLQHDAKERATAVQLLQHPFLRVDGDEDYVSCTLPSILEDYFKLGGKR